MGNPHEKAEPSHTHGTLPRAGTQLISLRFPGTGKQSETTGKMSEKPGRPDCSGRPAGFEMKNFAIYPGGLISPTAGCGCASRNR